MDSISAYIFVDTPLGSSQEADDDILEALEELNPDKVWRRGDFIKEDDSERVVKSTTGCLFRIHHDLEDGVGYSEYKVLELLRSEFELDKFEEIASRLSLNVFARLVFYPDSYLVLKLDEESCAYFSDERLSLELIAYCNADDQRPKEELWDRMLESGHSARPSIGRMKGTTNKWAEVLPTPDNVQVIALSFESSREDVDWSPLDPDIEWKKGERRHHPLEMWPSVAEDSGCTISLAGPLEPLHDDDDSLERFLIDAVPWSKIVEIQDDESICSKLSIVTFTPRKVHFALTSSIFRQLSDANVELRLDVICRLGILPSRDE
jgi:hypothetical protein